MTETESGKSTPVTQSRKSGGKKSAAVIPCDCPEFQTCMAAAKNDPTIAADDLLAMFRDIGVYGSLLELKVVAANLQQVLDLIASSEGWPTLPTEVLRWRPLVEWILRQDSSVIPDSQYGKNPYKSPLSGVCTISHPLYALLWWTTDQTQLENWHLLQGHVLLAHLRMICKLPQREYDYPTSVRAPYSDMLGYTYRAGVFLREISVRHPLIPAEKLCPERPPQALAASLFHFWEHFDKGKKQETLPEVSDEDELEEQAACAEELKACLLRAHKETLRQHLQGFIYMLATAYDLRAGLKYTETHGRGRREIIQGYLPLMDTQVEHAEPDSSDPQKPVRRLYKRAEAANSVGGKRGGPERYQSEFDIDADENEGEAFVEELPLCSHQTGGGAANLLTTALQGRVRAEALENQLFLWDYEHLTDTAIQHLQRSMGRDFAEALQKEGKKPSLRTQSLALLAVSFGTGVGLALGRQLKWVSSRQELTGHHQFAYQPGDGEQPGLWYVRSEAPSSWVGADYGAQDLCADIHDAILCLPDVGGYGRFVEQILQQYPDLRVLSSRVFKKRQGAYQQDIQHYLREMDPSGYLTLGRVENYLWRRCAGTGDIGEAGLICAKKQRLGQVRHFYTTLPQTQLVARYIQVLEQTAGLQEPPTEAENAPRSLPIAPTGYLGSLFRPKIEVIQSGVKGLAERLEQQGRALYAAAIGQSPRGAQALQADWDSYYNHYTLYTWLYFAYATASRAICAPFPDNPVEGTASGFMVHQDKSTLDRSHLRLLWLPQPLLQQLQKQWDLAVQQQELVSQRARNRVQGSNFLIRGRGKMIPLCPKNLRPKLQQILGGDMPVNSHRRFCRSHLLEQGCPAEIVDAFMGHWYAGESPWSRYSSQSALAYVAQLKPYLETMLDTLGFCRQPLPPEYAGLHP